MPAGRRTMKPDILFLDDSSTVLPILDALMARFAVHRLAEGAGREAVGVAVMPRVRGLVTTTNRGVEEKLIEALPALEIIVVSGGHLHGVAREYLGRRGIRLANTPGITVDDVADCVIGLMIAAARRICEGDRFVRAGRWPGGIMPFGLGIAGRTLGIVGLGRIGKQVAKRALGFDMEVRYCEPEPIREVPFPYHRDAVDLARASDILVVTCPSAPATRRIIGTAVLEALGPEGVLINVVKEAADEDALAAALARGTIAAAAMDVFDSEPSVAEALLARDNLVLTPHLAWKSHDAARRLAERTLANLTAHFDGRPLLNPVA